MKTIIGIIAGIFLAAVVVSAGCIGTVVEHESVEITPMDVDETIVIIEPEAEKEPVQGLTSGGSDEKVPAKELIARQMHGTESVFGGVVFGEFDITATMGGDMTITKRIESPIAGIAQAQSTIDATWTDLGNNQFKVETENATFNVTCDGEKMSFTVNPFEMGVINCDLVDMDVDIDLTEVVA